VAEASALPLPIAPERPRTPGWGSGGGDLLSRPGMAVSAEHKDVLLVRGGGAAASSVDLWALNYTLAVFALVSASCRFASGGGVVARRYHHGAKWLHKRVVCSLRLDPRLRRFLDAIADRRQLSFNSLVAMTLAEYWRFDPRRAARDVGGNGTVAPSPTNAAPEASDAAAVSERRNQAAHRQPKVGRNEECPCGSGKKYKSGFGKTIRQRSASVIGGIEMLGG